MVPFFRDGDHRGAGTDRDPHREADPQSAQGLAEYLDLSLGDLLKGIVLHAFEGQAPFGTEYAGANRAAQGRVRAQIDRGGQPSAGRGAGKAGEGPGKLAREDGAPEGEGGRGMSGTQRPTPVWYAVFYAVCIAAMSVAAIGLQGAFQRPPGVAAGSRDHRRRASPRAPHGDRRDGDPASGLRRRCHPRPAFG